MLYVYFDSALTMTLHRKKNVSSIQDHYSLIKIYLFIILRTKQSTLFTKKRIKLIQRISPKSTKNLNATQNTFDNAN
jgi:hypothetical protein